MAHYEPDIQRSLVSPVSIENQNQETTLVPIPTVESLRDARQERKRRMYRWSLILILLLMGTILKMFLKYKRQANAPTFEEARKIKELNIPNLATNLQSMNNYGK